jgi:hypothetical protein
MTHLRALFAAAIALLALSSAGCGKPEETPAAKTDQRVEEIVKRANGDWNSVSQTDKDYLVNEVARGSEMDAKMKFLSIQAKMNSKQGKGGPPDPRALMGR